MHSAFGMQMIMDGNGNYYKLNDRNQLVVASGRDDASIFTLYEANQRIGGGKKSYFYQTVPVEDTYECQEPFQVIEGGPALDQMPDMSTENEGIDRFDWGDYLEHFIWLTSQVAGRHDELTKQLSVVDQETSDIMHLVELYDLIEAEELHMVDKLKDIRQRRRDIKDEMLCLEYFRSSFGTAVNVKGARSILKQIKRLEQRIYQPRQLSELFDGLRGRECYKPFFYERKREEFNVVDTNEFRIVETEEKMEYTRNETVFDTRQNDWTEYVREQMEFYQNAPQYMINLQIEIESVDCAIEEALRAIEDANYNVAQGYKAFKELKDLRNERKEKQRELGQLELIVGGMDCAAMAERYQRILEELVGDRQ